MTPYDEAALSEVEWFDIPWSPDELEQQFRDTRLGEVRREHAFYRFWRGQIRDSGASLFRRADLESILQFAAWEAVVNDLIGSVAATQRLTPDDAAWLLQVLPASGWGRKQVQALGLVRDAGVSWQERLQNTLDLAADWAAAEVIKQIPPDESAAAREIIAASGRPKRARRLLDGLLSK